MPSLHKTGDVFTPTSDDMDVIGGILVAPLGDGQEIIAVTGQKTLALEAIDTYCRTVCGQPNLLDDATAPLTDAYHLLDAGHAVFTRAADDGWQVTPAAPDTAGAMWVTWFHGPSYRPAPQPYERRADARLW